MKNIGIPTNQSEYGPSTSNTFSEEPINVQEWIDDNLLEIKGDISFLQQYGITFPMLLKLARYYPHPEKKNFRWIVLTSEYPTLTIHLQSQEFSELKVQLNFDTKTINNISCMKREQYKNKTGIVYKGFVQQVLLAKELGFKYLYGLGGGDAKMRKKYKDENQGYFYWFQFGFLHNEEVYFEEKDIQTIIKKSENKHIRKCTSLNELLLLQDEDKERIGLEYWKKYGFGVEMVFDLSNDSTSMKLLKAYISNKQYENPKKYGEVGI